MGGWFTPEAAAELDPKTWTVLTMEQSQSLYCAHEGQVYAEPGQLFEDSVLLATYVWRKPKDVVVLIERSATA